MRVKNTMCPLMSAASHAPAECRTECMLRRRDGSCALAALHEIAVALRAGDALLGMLDEG